MCAHTLWDAPDGLVCQRTDVHTSGHVYAASDAPDRHTTTEAVQA